MTFVATVLTLYPEMFPGPLGVSLAGRAMAEGTWALDTVQIRDFAYDKHRTVDDTPAGGGAGMVLRVDVLAKAIDHARAFLPGTGRGATEGGGGAGAANPTSEGRESPHVPLHHPADGPPPHRFATGRINRSAAALPFLPAHFLELEQFHRDVDRPDGEPNLDQEQRERQQ